MANINMMHGDCMELMARTPDKYYDMAIVDPPYFSGPERREYYGQKESSLGIKRLYKKSNHWEIPTEGYWNELNRVSKKYIIWGCNYFPFSYHTGRVIWDKCNDSSDYSDAEIAATNLFNHVRIFRFMWNGMLQGESVNNGTKMQGDKKKNEKRIHPTQKPVALYKWLLDKYAKPKQRILDTHGGSGSIAIACHDMGFDLDWIELDKDYYEAACKRYQNHIKQLKIF